MSNIIDMSNIKDNTEMIALYKDKDKNKNNLFFFNMILLKFDRTCFNSEDNTYHIKSDKVDTIVPIEQCVFALPTDEICTNLVDRAEELEGKLHDTLETSKNDEESYYHSYFKPLITLSEIRAELLKSHNLSSVAKYSEELKDIYEEMDENWEELAELDRITNNK